MQEKERRGPGEHQPRGETRKAIIRYLLTAKTSPVPESDIREHLRSTYNIREPKGIRKQLDTIRNLGFIRRHSEKGRDTRWSVEISRDLLLVCRRAFEPETFYEMYSSGPVQEFLKNVKLFPETEERVSSFKGEFRQSQAEDVLENEELIRTILTWIDDAKYVSPSIFFHLREPTPAISLVASLLNLMAKDRKMHIEIERPPNDRAIPFFFGLFCRALACVLIDHEKYPTQMDFPHIGKIFTYDLTQRFFLRCFSFDVTRGFIGPICTCGREIGVAQAQRDYIDEQMWLIPHAIRAFPSRWI